MEKNTTIAKTQTQAKLNTRRSTAGLTWDDRPTCASTQNSQGKNSSNMARP